MQENKLASYTDWISTTGQGQAGHLYGIVVYSLGQQVENMLSGKSSKTNLAYETLLYRFIAY